MFSEQILSGFREGVKVPQPYVGNHVFGAHRKAGHSPKKHKGCLVTTTT
jgi:hypothetical protein